jgi:putative TPR-repeat-containing protein
LNDLQKAYIMGEDFYDRDMIVLWYGWLLNQPHKALPSDSISRFLQANYRTLVLENDGTLSVANILAHHFWGDSAQARHEMDELLTCDPNNKYFFEIAGFYALQGDTEKAIEVLRNGTKKGNYSFAALRDLPWLNSLKGVAEYESLIK